MNEARLTSAEARQVQACAAAAARRNRPAPILALAGLALIVSIVFAIASIAGARGAEAELARLAHSQAEVDQIAGEIDRLRAASSGTAGADRFARLLQLSKLEAISRRLDFPTPPTLLEQRPMRPLDSPIEKRRVDVTITNAPLESALRWINEAQKTIPDLFITAVELRPQPKGWTLRVQVARWELRP